MFKTQKKFKHAGKLLSSLQDPYPEEFEPEAEDLEEEFAERQRQGAPGRHKLHKRLDAYDSKAPGLTDGDLEPDWLAEELRAVRLKLKSKRQRA